MARFYGSMKGTRAAPVTRTGAASTGLSVHARGWHVGAEVVLQVENGEDVVYVYATGGSEGSGNRKLLARYTSLRGAAALVGGAA